MSAPSVHVWDRFERFWEIGFWSFLAFAAVRTLTAADLPTSARAVLLGCLGTIAVAFAVLRPGGRRADSGPREIAYLSVAITATSVGCAVEPSFALLLSIVFAQIWLYGPDHRTCLWLTALTGVSSTVGLLIANDWTWETFSVAVPVMLLSTFFSAALGLWISQIIHQSAERSLLILELEKARAELGQAYHTQGVQAERERLAQEIHDTLAQGYTSIIMLTQVSRAALEKGQSAGMEQRLATIEDVARENLGEARSLVAAFAPVGLDGTTLADAVRRLVSRFGAETQITAEVFVTGELTGLTRDHEVVLLRSAQEALANVRRHAAAGSVQVRLAGTPQQARVEVCDDGKGFDIWDPGRPLGFGLTGMRERARGCGGELTIDSSPGRGTRLTVRVPRVPVDERVGR